MIRRMFLSIEDWMQDESYLLEFAKFCLVFITAIVIVASPIVYLMNAGSRKTIAACESVGGKMTQTGVVRRRVYDPTLKMVREKDVSLIECVLPE